MEERISVLTPQQLRTQAELKLALSSPQAFGSLAEAKRLVHELQVYQIELQMQNEALRELAGSNRSLENLVAARSADLIAAAAALDAIQTASQAKSNFLAAMSHELRTPLHAIMAMTELAMQDPKDEDQLHCLSVVRAESEKLFGMICDVLDFAQIENGHITLDQIDLTLEAVLREVRDRVEPISLKKGLQLHFECPVEIGTLGLRGDRQRLGKILLNLIGNAVKFSETGSVKLRVTLVERTEADVLVRFEVEDSGRGIGESEQQRLFNVFEQLDNSTTRRFGGVGLGLAISRQLAHMMGGGIGVQSEPGKGSTFWFTARLANSAV